jgi:hypothetical protein
MTIKDSIERQESLGDSLFVADVVIVADTPSKKYGEAQIRIETLHGDKTITPDKDLPYALFYAKSSPESFGTFDVGDKVLVRFIGGNPSCPIIEGKVFNLEDVLATVPEYNTNYGKVKGIMSKKLKAAVFFNEETGTINLRFLNGSSIVIKDGEIIETTAKLTINVGGEAKVTAGSLTAEISGAANIKAASASVEASGVLRLKGATIMEN